MVYAVLICMDDDLDDLLTKPSFSSAQWVLFVLMGGFALLVVGLFALNTAALPEVKSLPASPQTADIFQDAKQVQITVSGAVVHPGAYTLIVPFGERPTIADLITAAGGLTSSADGTATASSYLSLPVNGAVLHIPMQGEQATTSTECKGQSGEPGINVNTASSQQLMKLVGVGEVRAKAIQEHRPYTSQIDLQQKTKIPTSVIEKLSAQLCF